MKLAHKPEIRCIVQHAVLQLGRATDVHLDVLMERFMRSVAGQSQAGVVRIPDGRRYPADALEGIPSAYTVDRLDSCAI